MPSKGAVFASAVLAVLLLSAKQVSAEPGTATAANAEPADFEETVEYVEPEGQVHLYPAFHWNEEGKFLLSCRLLNRSNADIPEAETEIIFPEDSDLILLEPFRTEPGQPSGIVTLSEDGKSCTLLLKDFRSGAETEFQAEGRWDGEAEEQPKEFRTVLTLRGYGLVHSTEGMCDIPEYPEEPEENFFLSVQLLESGRNRISVPYTDLRNINHELFMQNDANYAKINMQYIPYIMAEGDAPGRLRNLAVTLALSFGSMLGSFCLLHRILTDAAVRRDEHPRGKKQKSGRLS